MRKTRLLVSALVIVLLLAACAPAVTPAVPQAPAPQAVSPAQAAAAPVSPTRAAWEVTWEKTLAEAKKEGKVLFASSLGAEPRAAIVQSMNKAYGIDVEAVGGRTAEVNTRIFAERRAGLYLWDVFATGTGSPFTDMKPVGLIEKLDPTLILPDVTDPAVIKKVWFGGDLWWVDRDHTVLATLLFPYPPLAINTTMVNPAEIKSYKDFLDPKWKGKINIQDPTIPGTNFPSFVFGALGQDWFRQLVKNEPMIVRDQRQQVDWLAHNKVAIALAPKSEMYMEFKKAGAPIQVLVPSEGTWLSADSAALSIPTRSPHPNAAKIFINWYLSKEGQTVLSRTVGGQSGREDVPTDFLTPEQIRQPGTKYFEVEREEICLRKGDDFKLAKEIFAPIMK